jgi:low temperature requirement protein LtrA
VSVLPSAQGSRASWFEVFYDLVLVAAVLHGSNLFDSDPSLERGAWLALTLLVLLTMWLLTTLSFNAAPEDSVLRRMLTLVQMLALVIASLSVSRTGGLSDSTGLIALGVAFASVAVLYAMRARRGGSTRRGATIVCWSTTAAALVCLVGALLPEGSGPYWTHPRTYAFGLALALGLLPLITVYLGELESTGSLDREHMTERVGQLVIISLGESFADLILALGEFDSIPNPPYLVLTFVVIYAVWAIYFRTVLPPGIPHGAGRVRAWLGAHYVLIFGFIGTAAGFSALTIVPLDDASAALASFRLPLPLLYVMVGFILLTWIAGASDRSFLLVHIAAAVLLLGVTALSIFVIVDRPITMGALAAAIVVADVAVVAWIGRRTRQRLPVQAT